VTRVHALNGLAEERYLVRTADRPRPDNHRYYAMWDHFYVGTWLLGVRPLPLGWVLCCG